jgi:type VI secretion system protein ImpF
MAEPALHERLQPSLLDRLMDSRAAIERELARLRPRLMEALGPELGEELRRLLDPERRLGEPLRPSDLAPFEGLGEDARGLLERVVALEQQRLLETRQHHVISMERLRQCVMRDLELLFNTDNLGSHQPLEDFPHARRSVVNYGIPALAGTVLRGLDVERLERLVRDSVRDFEPRIRRDSLRLRALLDDEEHSRNALVFEIEGELWGEPLPMRIYLRTIVDLDDGSARVVEGPA